jgi:hypothetical protein
LLVYSEEILNPAIPMALRLSGILMGIFIVHTLSMFDTFFVFFFSLL